MDKSVLSNVDARTQLAGTNRLELLLFSLGTSAAGREPETFGLNVFKVQEVIRTPSITRVVDAPPHVVGMASLRGNVVSVVDLVGLCGHSSQLNDEGYPPMMIVTEFSGSVQAFLVQGVETIVRIDWSDVRQPPDMLANGKVTSVTQLEGGRLVSILDVEQILYNVIGHPETLEEQPQFLDIPAPVMPEGIRVICADDVEFARKQLRGTLDQMGIESDFYPNGADAWTQIDRLAAYLTSNGKRFSDSYPLVITDIEMPELDGFILTKRIKSDPRLDGVKVLIHSSMSGESNKAKALEMGADGFLAKFSKHQIIDQLSKFFSDRKAA